jgi:hypothetical protein
MKKTCEHG